MHVLQSGDYVSSMYDVWNTSLWKRQRKKNELWSTPEAFFSSCFFCVQQHTNCSEPTAGVMESNADRRRLGVSRARPRWPSRWLAWPFPHRLTFGFIAKFCYVLLAEKKSSAWELLQPVNTSSGPLDYLLIFPPSPHEAHPCKSDTFFSLIWRCCSGHLSLCRQVEALSPFPAEIGFIYRPLLLGLTATVIVGQVLRVTHLSGDTMIHGSNSIPPTASWYVSARAVWVSGDRLSQFTRVSTSASWCRTGSSCRLNLMSGFIFFSVFCFF